MLRRVFLTALLTATLLPTACSVTAPPDDKRDAGEQDPGPPPLAECEDNTNCSGGEVCREGHCRTVCDDETPCSGFYGQCDPARGYCVECTANEQCDADEACFDGLCEFYCSADDQCREGQACDENTGQCYDKECERNADCQGGFGCDDFRCVNLDPVICEANTGRCDGDTVVACNGDGTRETRTDCQADERCVVNGTAAACLVLVCTPDEIGCVDDATAFVCDATGTGRTDLPCNASQYCQGGVCRNQQCEPQSVTCEGNNLVACNGLGSSSESVSCDATPACEAEPFGCACVDAACQARTCRPEEAECAANGFRRCNANGTGYEAVVPCAEGCAAGRCVSSTCTTGETLCSGDVLLTCNAGGNGYDETDCGASQETCIEGAAGAACGAPICEPLATSCSVDGRSVITCNAFGTATSEAPCGDGRYCDVGVCKDQVCEPGTRSCAGATSVQTCDALGSELTVTSCAGGRQCQEGQCVEPACVPDCAGRTCGPDPVCGTSCGSCDGVCTEDGQCTAAAADGLEVVLTWDTAMGDLDLHLARDTADPPCDNDSCYYANCKAFSTGRPDWDGSGNVSAGDPILDIDDLAGFGPEVIHLPEPANVSYRARVHAYDLPASTTATVVVRANGIVVGTFHQLFTADNDWWDGVTISWSGASATASNTSQVTPDVSCTGGGGGGGGGGGDGGVPDDGGTAVSCVNSSDCGSGEFCANQPLFGGVCAAGCADNGDCTAQKCDGNGQCVPLSTPLAGWGQACQADADCQAGFFCGFLSQQCEERCAPSGVAGAQRACGTDPSCCPRSNASFCVDDAFFGVGASCSN